MKKMIISSVLFFAVFFSGTVLQAQDKAKKTAEERAEKMTAIMTEKLNLTADQVISVLEINSNMANEIAAINVSDKSRKEEVRKQYKQLDEKHSAAMKEILTEVQFDKYVAMKEKKRAYNKEKGKHKRKEHKKDRNKRM